MEYAAAKTAVVNFRLPQHEKDAVYDLARARDVPASHILRFAVRSFLQEREPAEDEK